MKTLDEVIKALECCKSDNPCNDKCPYARDECRSYALETDALFYLKEYRDVTEKCESALAERYPDQNDPLSWDELKTMLGKPVWVEHKHYNKWLIVYEVYENTIVLDGNGFYTQYFSDDNEKENRWQAYRKERS